MYIIRKIILSVFVTLFIPLVIFAQDLTQTIRGQVADVDTKQSLAGAVIIVLGTNPQQGTEANADGSFTIEKIKLGRYSVQVSLVGNNLEIIPEVLLTSGKEVIWNIALKEKIVRTEEIKVTADIEKTNRSIRMH